MARRRYTEFGLSGAMRCERLRGSRRISDRQRRENIKRVIAEFKAIGCEYSGGCTERDPDKLVPHHRDPRTKLFDMSEACRARKTVQEVIAELDKCDCLCKYHHEQVVHAVGYVGPHLVTADSKYNKNSAPRALGSPSSADTGGGPRLNAERGALLPPWRSSISPDP